MRITDRSPTGRGLQTIFFPAEPKPVMPSEVSDEIVLIHPAIPPMVGFKESRFFFQGLNSAVGVPEVVSSLVPTDRYWWVQFVDFRHDDPVDRTLRLIVRDTVPNDVLIESSLVPVGTEVRFLNRPFILPNDMQLVLQANTIAAAQRVRLRFYFYELLHAEVNPSA